MAIAPPAATAPRGAGRPGVPTRTAWRVFGAPMARPASMMQRRDPSLTEVAAASDRLVADALRSCESEPIETPGAIQPHGVLLVLDPADGTPIAASANIPSEAVATWPSEAAASAVRLAAAGAPPRARRYLGRLAGSDGRRWDASLSRAAGDDAPVLVTFEPASAEPASAEPADHPAADPAAFGDDPETADAFLFLGAEIERFGAAATVEAVSEIAADAIRRLTGFDRVMTYRFAPDWSGIVVAESRASAEVASFTGLRFPASDIPERARALYGTDRIRLIPDARASAVPLRAVSGDLSARPPIDLAGVVLRAVSPLHLVYLANMGVRASMSVAVVANDGRLWGLLACHHERATLAPDRRARAGCLLIARMLGARLAVIDAELRAAGRLRVAELREAVMARNGEPETAVDEVTASFPAALDADRAVLIEGDTVLADAADDRPAALDGLVAALEQAAPEGAFETDHLRAAPLGAPAAALADAGWAGLLARRVADGARGQSTWLVWLRLERRHRVRWAGSPDKQAIIDPAGVPILSPRHSFAAWNEEVREHAEPFRPADLAAAASLADTIGRALARRNAAAARAVREVRARNEQVRFFADAAVHDLREPLWQIQVFASLLRSDFEEGRWSESAAEMAGTIEASSARMREMLDDLARFAAAGADPDSLRDHLVCDLVDEASGMFADRLRAIGGVETRTDCDLRLRCDGAQIRRVFQNLISNSIKYRDVSRPLRIVIACGTAASGEVLITYTDNGTGFDPAQSERIFEPFRRLGAQVSTDGEPEGLGLGLAICRRIVEGHDGRITASAVPGVRARFDLVLPQAGPPS